MRLFLHHSVGSAQPVSGIALPVLCQWNWFEESLSDVLFTASFPVCLDDLAGFFINLANQPSPRTRLFLFFVLVGLEFVNISNSCSFIQI